MIVVFLIFFEFLLKALILLQTFPFIFSFFLDNRKFVDLFTSNESWRRPIIASLAQQMREAYTNKFLRDSKKSHNAELKKQFESDEYYESLEELLCLQ